MIFRQSTSTWSELVIDSEDGDSGFTDFDPSGTIEDTPLGVVDEASYGQTNVVLEPGDLFLSFSDSVTESENLNGQQIGASGVLEIISQLSSVAPDQLVSAIVREITAMNDTNLDQDDTTIVLLQATGTGAKLKDSFLAPLRLLTKPSDNTQWDEK